MLASFRLSVCQNGSSPPRDRFILIVVCRIIQLNFRRFHRLHYYIWLDSEGHQVSGTSFWRMVSAWMKYSSCRRCRCGDGHRHAWRFWSLIAWTASLASIQTVGWNGSCLLRFYWKLLTAFRWKVGLGMLSVVRLRFRCVSESLLFIVFQADCATSLNSASSLTSWVALDHSWSKDSYPVLLWLFYFDSAVYDSKPVVVFIQLTWHRFWWLVGMMIGYLSTFGDLGALPPSGVTGTCEWIAMTSCESRLGFRSVMCRCVEFANCSSQIFLSSCCFYCLFLMNCRAVSPTRVQRSSEWALGVQPMSLVALSVHCVAAVLG